MDAKAARGLGVGGRTSHGARPRTAFAGIRSGANRGLATLFLGVTAEAVRSAGERFENAISRLPGRHGVRFYRIALGSVAFCPKQPKISSASSIRRFRKGLGTWRRAAMPAPLAMQRVL